MIRTDRKAFGVAAAFAAAFYFFCLKNGLLFLPVLFKSFDKLVIWLALGAAGYVILFAGAHFAMRRLKFGGRGAYALAGGVSLAIMFTLLDLTAAIDAFREGYGLVRVIAPGILGAIFGFLYAYRAGWDQPDDIEGLADRVASTSGDRSSPALVETGVTKYFDGPVQVRTSVPIMLLAALFGSILMAVATVLSKAGWETLMLPERALGPVLQHGTNAILAYSLEATMLGIITILPMTVMICAGHYALRGLGKTSPVAFFVVGLTAPILFTIFTLGMFMVIGVSLIIPMGIAMVVYRHMAGLEPRPVREDILAKDHRNLVGADHPRRRFGRVIR
ncbi:hypothetical protein [Brevundimonas sp. G8]|uniref:hypothetical protein n=1 Tax=Brevundimonas sp. G8 TaxID=1350776 RepID=UPI0012EF3992|nr:hypothetical protein [Brevundimonas sp. G8]VXB75901.1 conserved membrane hypothetical protein [Brevundimonas sp. G8]